MSLLATLLLAASAAHAAGAVKVSVKYEGQVPNFKPIDMAQDKICIEHNKDKPPLVNEVLVLGEGQTLANVFVEVSGGLPAGQTYPLPTEPVQLTQEGCHYSPRAFGIRAGQTLKIVNPDGTLHNVNAQPRVNTPFNRGMPGNVKEIEVVFDKPEPIFPIACNVHSWMFSYCTVYDHPYFAVTDKTGCATLADLPAGEYEIKVTHERLGEHKEKVSVQDGQTSELSFSFSPPTRK